PRRARADREAELGAGPGYVHVRTASARERRVAKGGHGSRQRHTLAFSPNGHGRVLEILRRRTMTALALRDTPDMHTSAIGSMYRPGIAPIMEAIPIFPTLGRSATTSTYAVPQLVERTAAGPAGQIEHVPAESTA